MIATNFSKIIIKNLLLIIIITITTTNIAYAQNFSEEYPVFEKIRQQNLLLAQENAVKITFLVAFLAGILSIFAPCVLPFLPAFFAYSFKEKANITKMTFMFFLGFAATFTTFGVIAGVLGLQTLIVLPYKNILIPLAGIVIILFGILTMLGKGFYFIKQPQMKTKNDAFGIFLFGVLFAIGWAACLGPVLGAILSIGAILQNYLQAGLLLITYAFGVFVPLFILAFFYDKLHVHAFRFMNKKVKIGKFQTLLPSFISGLLLIITGLFFVFLEGTDFINSITFFGLKKYFYDWQRALVDWQYANVVGAVALIVIVILIVLFWKHRNGMKRSR